MSRQFPDMKTLGLIILFTALAAVGSEGLQTRVSPQSTRANRQKQPPGLVVDPSCGTLDDIAKRVEVCAKPLMDLLQGTVEKWPRTDDDAQALCNSFAVSEKCIRETSRKCAKGIHKTIISTIANSIQRVRKRECNAKEKMPAIVKTTMCLEKHQDVVHNWMANVTGRLNVVQTQITDPVKKISSLCCMVDAIEKEIKAILNPYCPNESAFIVRLYRSVVDDAMEIICRSPKCTNFLKGYKVTTDKDFSGIIAVMLKIIFSLDL